MKSVSLSVVTNAVTNACGCEFEKTYFEFKCFLLIFVSIFICDALPENYWVWDFSIISCSVWQFLIWHYSSEYRQLEWKTRLFHKFSSFWVSIRDHVNLDKSYLQNCWWIDPGNPSNLFYWIIQFSFSTNFISFDIKKFSLHYLALRLKSFVILLCII